MNTVETTTSSPNSTNAVLYAGILDVLRNDWENRCGEFEAYWLKRLFSDNEFEVDMYLVGLREYPFLKIVEQIHNNHSNTEMILKEIAFKAEAEGIK